MVNADGAKMMPAENLLFGSFLHLLFAPRRTGLPERKDDVEELSSHVGLAGPVRYSSNHVVLSTRSTVPVPYLTLAFKF